MPQSLPKETPLSWRTRKGGDRCIYFSLQNTRNGGGGSRRTWILWRRQKIGVKDLLEEEKQRPANMVRFGNVRPPLSCLEFCPGS